jgi:hypothetical protein
LKTGIPSRGGYLHQASKLKYEGSIWPTKQSGNIQVLKYVSSDKVFCKFLNTGYTGWFRIVNVCRGEAVDPYARTVYGVGYLGHGKYTRKEFRNVYLAWVDMLGRCYCPSMQTRHETYSGCVVCEEWHNFQNFCEWFINNCHTKLKPNIDKDIINPFNKTYSPENCCVSPRVINIAVICRRKSDTIFNIGLSKGSYRAQTTKRGISHSLGSYKKYEDAREVYVVNKNKYIRELAEEYKNEISESVYQILKNYDCRAYSKDFSL